jgi:multimeric flavodoxin WrbA
MENKILIVGINGSPHKNGTTSMLLKRVLNSSKKSGAETLLIHLVDKNIKPCLGCYSKNSELCKYPCKQKDDMQEIHRLIIKADGIVFASPVYWFNMSGLMKNFVDRLTCLACSGYLIKGKVAGYIAASKESEGGRETAAASMLTAMTHLGLISPPFAMIWYPGLEDEYNWALKDTVVLGKNMVEMCKLLKKIKWTPTAGEKDKLRQSIIEKLKKENF